MEQTKEVSQFKQEWEAKKLLKRSKKKAKKVLMQRGHSQLEARKLVNASIMKIADNRPERKAAGRGG